MTARRPVSALWLFVCLVLLPPLADAQPVEPVKPPPGYPRSQPSRFRFDIEEVTLKFGERVVHHDRFRERRLRPMVSMGRISADNVRDGRLKIDHLSTSNLKKRFDVYVAWLTLPIDTGGQVAFLGRDAFPLELSVRVRNPRFTGFEKLKIGLLDREALKNVAAISVGRLPLPFPPIGPVGGGEKIIDLLSLVSNPAIVLNRVEEPDVMGEIVMDHAELPSPRDIRWLEMTLRIGRDGQLSGSARAGRRGAQVTEIRLAPKAQEPREFFERRSRLSADLQLSASVYVETMPAPSVTRVEPKEVTADTLRRGGPVQLRIEGIGFGPDSRVEVVPERGNAIKASAVKLRLEQHGAEGVVLLADVALGDPRPRNYSVRVTTGGQTTVFKNALRVF